MQSRVSVKKPKYAQASQKDRLQVQAQDLHSADMDTSMGGSVDSKTCLDQGRCDPLAGHSVVGWIPNQPAPGPTLPTTLVLAHMDSIGLMHKDIIVCF